MKPDLKEIATSIMNDVESYKVCTVCGSVVDKALESCPDCYAYRFDSDPNRVSNAAIDLATQPRRAVGHLELTLED